MRVFNHPSVGRALEKSSTSPPSVLVTNARDWFIRKSSKLRQLLKAKIIQPKARAWTSSTAHPDGQVSTAPLSHSERTLEDENTTMSKSEGQFPVNTAAGASINSSSYVNIQDHSSRTAVFGNRGGMATGQLAERPLARNEINRLAPQHSAPDSNPSQLSLDDSSRSCSGDPLYPTSKSTLESASASLAAEHSAPSTHQLILDHRLDPTSLQAINGEGEKRDQLVICNMCILMPHDPNGSKALKCFGIIDSGSPVCLTWHKVLDEIGYASFIQKHTQSIALRAVTGHQLHTVGKSTLTWKVANAEKLYATSFIVLKDPDNREPDFDFLLGRDWIDESGALMIDYKKLPQISFIVVDEDGVSRPQMIIPHPPGHLVEQMCA